MKAMIDFSQALIALKEGKHVRNTSWNGQGMYLALQRPDEHSKMGQPYIYIAMPIGHQSYSGKLVPWTPSQLDLMSVGWEICDEEDSTCPAKVSK